LWQKTMRTQARHGIDLEHDITVLSCEYRPGCNRGRRLRHMLPVPVDLLFSLPPDLLLI
jgi:hypothetical protein